MATTTEAGQPRPGEVSSGARSWQRGFWSLFITQFQGAFSDNLYKFLVVFLISDRVSQSARDQYISAVFAVFSVPFILFSMAGGFLADRFPKRAVVIGTKIAEVVIMALGTVGLATGNIPLLMAVVFLMSAQSAFFGPAKYALLPEMLPAQRLSWGNGMLGLGTFVAIISGGVVAGKLYGLWSQAQAPSGVLLVLLAGVGLASSFGILKLPAANPEKEFRVNFLSELLTSLKAVRRDRVLSLAILGSVYFWFLAALFGEPTIFVYSKDVLRLEETQIAMLRACLAIGIGVGSAAAGFLSGRKIEYGLIPLGAFGLSASAALLAFPGRGTPEVAVILGFLGFSGGFYVVPINALIQHRPDSREKGAVIAANAWLTSVAVFLAAGAFWVLKSLLRLEPTTIFLVGAGVTFLGTCYAVRLVPDSLLRLLLWFLTHSLYRIKVQGRDNIPDKGGALFVSNHLSLADALLVLASTDRFVRFIMLKDVYERPLIKPFARVMGAIPISSRQRPREMIHALREASESIKRGEVVCIFAEGQITRIGQLLPFRRGFERIMQGVDAPIIPICLDDVWGSIFSYERHRFLWKIPRRIPYPVTVSYGKPMPASATPFEVRRAVQELSAEAWRNRKDRMRPLQRSFVETARRYPFRFAMADARVPNLRFGAALTRTTFLARRLQPEWRGQKMVGILLPPSVPGALVNFAALLMGKVPVNLNYTASEDIIASCVTQCGIETVISSRAFLDKVRIKVPGRCVLLEELAAKPQLAEKLVALGLTWFAPAGLLEKLLGREQRITLDDPATVIFSSGSTGDPKGVVLTHYNIASNIEQLEQTFALDRRDRVLGVLPFFHSFGFTGTLCLPGVLGAGVVYHPSPLDAEAIGGLVEKYAATFLLATPTFLQLYLRSCSADEFGSLQFVMAGAEKLSERLASAFEEKFGIRPLEGYGCTECSPVVSVNTHDFRSAGIRQVGAKRGKIGHPLPGITVRIVDAETRAPLPVNQPGLLQVKGPNVMHGYLGRPEKTAEVLADGWYTTGDIAAEDEDGFLQITDRLSRFSKIGGEMVPHIRVEEKLHELAGATEQTFVVTGVPDEKKGERLVVLHTANDANLKAVLEKLAGPRVRDDLPNLWVPRPNQFYRVDALPLLGTGKLDLRKIRELAIQFSAVTE
ncbi:MAG TPA: acyl-[ACP]--phospholipid O-acyltransferase [Verrucomicrobiae bacterium]|nr:acyl-[ACP]--phospholipid O-acyltransferase [Verrucomicrobiae bacterium]